MKTARNSTRGFNALFDSFPSFISMYRQNNFLSLQCLVESSIGIDFGSYLFNDEVRGIFRSPDLRVISTPVHDFFLDNIRSIFFMSIYFICCKMLIFWSNIIVNFRSLESNFDF